MAEEVFDTDPGEGIDLALPGDFIRRRHIATRASLLRRIIVLTTDEGEFEGYAIGLDQDSLQILELPSGDVSTIALKYIVSITDDVMFSKLTPEEKGVVERRTASFRKTCEDWLVKNWPKVYDRRREGERPRARTWSPRYEAQPVAGGSVTHADQEVRD